MRPTPTLATLLAITAILPATAHAQWATLVDETDSRLVLDVDFEYLNLEKDIEWGDFDQDGDIDVVVAMKFVGSVEGGWPNLILMNENGVLVDRTAEYGSSSDIAGDMAFFEDTNDRDIRAMDFDGDGDLDLITTTTMSDDLDWTLGQPRAYVNLGNDGNGNWLGFHHERDRIPEMFAMNGSTANPRFCDVAVGDFNGDGYPDLFWTDYDTPETANSNVCIDLNGDGDTSDPRECQFSPSESASDDFDSKLVLNWGDTVGGPGPGYFYDTENTIMTESELSTDFGNTAEAADMNGDGMVDILHVNTLGVNILEVLWQSGATAGEDFQLETIYTGAPYFMTAGDLDGDADLDIVIVDDSQDRYAINNGNGADGFANFTTYVIDDSLSEFGNTSKLFDLDNDGDLDCFIADVDADLPSFCPTTGRRAHFYENTGDLNNLLVETTNPIPTSQLAASFDIAPIDINGDGWLDLVLCRCSGFTIYMNQPPVRIDFDWPVSAPPSTVEPGSETPVVVRVSPVGADLEPGSVEIQYSIDGAAFASIAMQDIGNDDWSAALPAIDCGQTIEFYAQAELVGGSQFADPPSAPGSVYLATPVSNTKDTLEDFESSDAGFTTAADGSTTAGFWERANPIGTVTSGMQLAPDNDATPDGTLAWITQNGVEGGSAGAADIDQGPVTLTSPVIDLTDGDATLSMMVWFGCDDAVLNPPDADVMLIQVTNNGSDWTTTHTVTADTNQDGSINATDADWFERSFTVSSYVQPTANVQVRFVASDNPNNSVTEAGVDDFMVTRLICENSNDCPADLNNDGQVNGADLSIILGGWGEANADITGDGTVDGADLAMVLGSWGDC